MVYYFFNNHAAVIDVSKTRTPGRDSVVIVFTCSYRKASESYCHLSFGFGTMLRVKSVKQESVWVFNAHKSRLVAL